MLTTPEAVNLNAQIELLVGGQIDPSKLAAIDRQVGQASQEVLDRLFSAMPTEFATSQAALQVLPAIGSSEDPVPVTHEQSFPDFIQLARQLWRADFVKTAATRLEASENLTTDIALANLAATLPCDSIRCAFARRWEQQWASEASTVENARLFSAGARSGIDCGVEGIAAHYSGRKSPGRCKSQCKNRRNGPIAARRKGTIGPAGVAAHF